MEPTFVAQYTLQISPAPVHGLVTGDGGLSCGVGGTGGVQHPLDAGTVVNLAAVADTGYALPGGRGRCARGRRLRDSEMDGPKTVEPTFVAQYTLQVSPVPLHGLVTGDGGLSCGVGGTGTCSAAFNAGTVVNLAAVADAVAPYRVDGDIVHGVAVRGRTMRRPKTVEPTFVAQYTLQVSPVPLHGLVTGDGGLSCGVGGTGTCSAAFNAGTVVNLAAVADAGSAPYGVDGDGLHGVAVRGDDGRAEDGGADVRRAVHAAGLAGAAARPGDGRRRDQLRRGRDGDVQRRLQRGDGGEPHRGGGRGVRPYRVDGGGVHGVAVRGDDGRGEDGGADVRRAVHAAGLAGAAARPGDGRRRAELRRGRDGDVQRRLQRGDGGEPGRGGGRRGTPTGWTGTVCTGSPCAVTMDGPKTVEPTFVAQYTLQVSPVPLHGLVTGDGGLSCGVGGTGTCSAAFNAGTVVNLAAVADTGYALTGWTGTSCTGSPCAVTMDGPKTVEPTFVEQYTLQISPVPVHGLVTGGGGISCGSGGSGVCSAAFNAGTVVNLAAVADTGYALTGWTGTVCTGSPCAVTMDGPKTVEPTFVAQYTLQISPVPVHGLVTGDGRLSCGVSGTGTCSAAFNAGTVVNLTAVADTGYAYRVDGDGVHGVAVRGDDGRAEDGGADVRRAVHAAGLAGAAARPGDGRRRAELRRGRDGDVQRRVQRGDGGEPGRGGGHGVRPYRVDGDIVHGVAVRGDDGRAEDGGADVRGRSSSP